MGFVLIVFESTVPQKIKCGGDEKAVGQKTKQPPMTLTHSFLCLKMYEILTMCQMLCQLPGKELRTR